jgi:predicted nucleic acid-binding protein
MTEVTRNLQKKGDASALRTFFDLLAAVQPEMVDPPKRTIAQATKVINEKDAKILSAAMVGHCDVLVTLDRRHFFKPEVTKLAAAMAIVLPEDLLR